MHIALVVSINLAKMRIFFRLTRTGEYGNIKTAMHGPLYKHLLKAKITSFQLNFVGLLINKI